MMTRKQLLRFIVGMKMAASGNSVCFRYCLPRRMKRWNADPLNLLGMIAFRDALESYVFLPAIKWPWLADSVSFDGGMLIQESLMYDDRK